jgi:VRR-NUC domain
MGFRLSNELERKCLELAGVLQAPASVAAELSEKDFMEAVVDLAKRNGWRCYHAFSSRKSEAGFPDLVLLRGSRLIVAELKVGDGRTTAAQDSWLEAFADAGVLAVVWRPEQWESIERELRQAA